MGGTTLPKVDAVTAIDLNNDRTVLIGVCNAAYDRRMTQHESLINSHHVRANGIEVHDITKSHGGKQIMVIKGKPDDIVVL